MFRYFSHVPGTSLRSDKKQVLPSGSRKYQKLLPVGCIRLDTNPWGGPPSNRQNYFIRRKRPHVKSNFQSEYYYSLTVWVQFLFLLVHTSDRQLSELNNLVKRKSIFIQLLYMYVQIIVFPSCLIMFLLTFLKKLTLKK